MRRLHHASLEEGVGMGKKMTKLQMSFDALVESGNVTFVAVCEFACERMCVSSRENLEPECEFERVC